MPIVASELKLMRSASVSNTAASNGGRFGTAEVVSAVNNNIFPDVTQAERTSGLTSFRKVFHRNINAADLSLLNPRVFLENYTGANDAVVFHAGSQVDLQSDLTGSELLFGAGKLDASVSAGATSITVLLESSSIQFFRNGDKIRISDRATIDAVGNEEFALISGTPSLVGSVVTLTLGTALQNNFNASNTRVANVYEPAAVEATVSNIVVNTAGNGDYNNAGAPIDAHNVGSEYDDWTLTFTSSTAFNCVGTREGSAGSGSTLADFAPVNPATSTPYFTVLSAGFTGVWASGDTLVFRTNPAAVPIWLKRVVPAATAAFSANKFFLALDGETA